MKNISKSLQTYKEFEKLIGFGSLSIIALLFCLVLHSSMKQPGAASLTANFNGTEWSCNQVGVTVQNYNGNTTLLIHAQNPPTGGKIEYVYVTISFSGVGTYAFGNKDDKASIKVVVQNKTYNSDTRMKGGGSGTIKITEYAKPPSPGKFGKVVGEFNGTIKFLGNTLTIINGKFSSNMVL